jgi:hypothetical protein
MFKSHTIAICDYPILSDNGRNCLDSIKKYLNPDDYELLYIAQGRSHAEQLNSAIDASRTPYILFVDNDTVFSEKDADIFKFLDNFWEEKKDSVGTISFSVCGEPHPVDETCDTPYMNFYITSYNKKAEVCFFEEYKYTQCLDVAFFRLLQYLGWGTYGCSKLGIEHRHTNKTGNSFYDSYVKANQDLMRKMFGCETNAAVKDWSVFEQWLKSAGYFFRTREETLEEEIND